MIFSIHSQSHDNFTCLPRSTLFRLSFLFLQSTHNTNSLFFFLSHSLSLSLFSKHNHRSFTVGEEETCIFSFSSYFFQPSSHSTKKVSFFSKSSSRLTIQTHLSPLGTLQMIHLVGGPAFPAAVISLPSLPLTSPVLISSDLFLPSFVVSLNSLISPCTITQSTLRFLSTSMLVRVFKLSISLRISSPVRFHTLLQTSRP